MILSNDQKHTTTFGARAFCGKKKQPEGEEEEITSSPHDAAFLPFLYSCCNELLLELSQRFFVRLVLFVLRLLVSGLCNSSAFSSAFVPFAPKIQFVFLILIRTTTYAYIIITISQRRERKREREKGEKLFAASPSHRKNHFNETKKRERLIERITTTTRKKRIVVKSNSARIQEK